MSFNTFGHLFRVTTFGESHGPAIGCVVDGCPPLLPLDVADIQADLDAPMRVETWFDAADFAEALEVARRRAEESPLTFQPPMSNER